MPLAMPTPGNAISAPSPSVSSSQVEHHDRDGGDEQVHQRQRQEDLPGHAHELVDAHARQGAAEPDRDRDEDVGLQEEPEDPVQGARRTRRAAPGTATERGSRRRRGVMRMPLMMKRATYSAKKKNPNRMPEYSVSGTRPPVRSRSRAGRRARSLLLGQPGDEAERRRRHGPHHERVSKTSQVVDPAGLQVAEVDHVQRARCQHGHGDDREPQRDLVADHLGRPRPWPPVNRDHLLLLAHPARMMPTTERPRTAKK